MNASDQTWVKHFEEGYYKCVASYHHFREYKIAADSLLIVSLILSLT